MPEEERDTADPTVMSGQTGLKAAHQQLHQGLPSPDFPGSSLPT